MVIEARLCSCVEWEKTLDLIINSDEPYHKKYNY